MLDMAVVALIASLCSSLTASSEPQNEAREEKEEEEDTGSALGVSEALLVPPLRPLWPVQPALLPVVLGSSPTFTLSVTPSGGEASGVFLSGNP